MSETQIAWLELIIVGGLGAIFILTGVIIHIAAKRKIRSCTRQTEGIVTGYGFAGGMYPIVEYRVDGTCRKARKKIRGIMTTKFYGWPIQSKAYEDEKGWLRVKTGTITNWRQLAEQLWPMGSRMTVFYDPNAPKRCYVDRPIAEGATCVVFILVGALMIIMGVLGFFLIGL